MFKQARVRTKTLVQICTGRFRIRVPFSFLTLILSRPVQLRIKYMKEKSNRSSFDKLTIKYKNKAYQHLKIEAIIIHKCLLQF